MPTTLRDMPVDLLSCSAHKLHGPKGSGALYVRRGVRIEPRIVGGPQERDRRGGTENVPGIVGFGVAATLAARWLRAAGGVPPAALRDRFESEIVRRVGDARVNGAAAPRVWNTSNIGFPRLEAEALLLLLSEGGVYASAGAACSSGSLDPSPVLLAMGVAPEVAHGSIRFSLSRHTTAEEIDEGVEVVVACVGRLRSSLSAV
jgi:cysteine desulfurase